jgi:hypothetical protein
MLSIFTHGLQALMKKEKLAIKNIYMQGYQKADAFRHVFLPAIAAFVGRAESVRGAKVQVAT